MGTFANLTAHRAGLRDDVYERYKTLKGRGVAEESARNIAAAQAAQSGQTKPRARAGVYRRELDSLLKEQVKALAVQPWRLPT